MVPEWVNPLHPAPKVRRMVETAWWQCIWTPWKKRRTARYLFRQEKRQVFDWLYLEMGNLAIKKWKNWDLAKKLENGVTLQFDVSKPSIFLKIFWTSPMNLQRHLPQWQVHRVISTWVRHIRHIVIWVCLKIWKMMLDHHFPDQNCHNIGAYSDLRLNDA